MLAALIICLPLFALIPSNVLFDESVIAMNQQNPSKYQLSFLEVRKGGGLEHMPHHVWLTLDSEGRLFRGARQLPVEKESVLSVLRDLSNSNLCNTEQSSFSQSLHSLGELDISLRGGTGVYTLTFQCNGDLKTLTLNRPNLYESSKLPEAREFALLIQRLHRLVRGL